MYLALHYCLHCSWDARLNTCLGPQCTATPSKPFYLHFPLSSRSILGSRTQALSPSGVLFSLLLAFTFLKKLFVGLELRLLQFLDKPEHRHIQQNGNDQQIDVVNRSGDIDQPEEGDEKHYEGGMKGLHERRRCARREHGLP